MSKSADSNCPGHCVQWPAAVPRWLRCAHCSQHLPGCEPRPQPQHCPPSALPRTPLSPAPGLTCCPAGQQHLIIDNLLTSLKSTASLVITPEICIIMAETGPCKTNSWLHCHEPNVCDAVSGRTHLEEQGRVGQQHQVCFWQRSSGSIVWAHLLAPPQPCQVLHIHGHGQHCVLKST